MPPAAIARAAWKRGIRHGAHHPRCTDTNVNVFPYIVGGFSRHSYVLPASGRIRVPDSVSDELASVAACAVRSAANAVEQAGQTTSDDVILIQGSGPVGLFATAMLASADHGSWSSSARLTHG
jgi:threonine dehydrogenase-like Zn-dependent dehydrogenase